MAHKQADHTGDYKKAAWLLTFFLILDIILNPVIIATADDVHSLRGVLVWNIILVCSLSSTLLGFCEPIRSYEMST